MIRYREFLYAVLSPEEVQEKYRNYLLPEQILDCDDQVRSDAPRVDPCRIMTLTSKGAGAP